MNGFSPSAAAAPQPHKPAQRGGSAEGHPSPVVPSASPSSVAVRDVRERSGTVALFATLAEGMEEMQKRIARANLNGGLVHAGWQPQPQRSADDSLASTAPAHAVYYGMSTTTTAAAARRDSAAPRSPLVERSARDRPRPSAGTPTREKERERERERDKERERERDEPQRRANTSTTTTKKEERREEKKEEKKEKGRETTTTANVSGSGDERRRRRADSDASSTRDRRASDSWDTAGGEEARKTAALGIEPASPATKRRGGGGVAPSSPATEPRKRLPSVGSRGNKDPSEDAGGSPEKREERKEERKREERSGGGGGGGKAKAAPGADVSGNNVARRNRSGSLGEAADKAQNNVAVAAAKSRHRRSRSRLEGRAATDEIRLNADVTAADVSLGGRRERRSSGAKDLAATRQPLMPALGGGLADRSPTPRVAPLDLTRPRPPLNWSDEHCNGGDEPGAGDGGAPKSGGRKSSLLDKMAHLLLSPGRRQRDGESATEQTAPGAVGGSRSQQGSRRPSNSSLSDVGGDSAPVAAQLSDSAGSNKTRTPRERGRKDSAAAAAAAAAAADERSQASASAERSRSASASGDDAATKPSAAAAAVSYAAPLGQQQAESVKREAGGIGGPDTSHDRPTDEAAIAPKRRAVMVLRKRFNTGPSQLVEPALKRTERSKQLKQQAGAWVSTRASDPLSLDDYPSTTGSPGDGGLGAAGRSGRSASNPNVSRSELMKVKWGDCARDKLDLEDQSSSPSSPRNGGGGGGEELNMVRGIGVGNAMGMGTVLVRDEIQSDGSESTTDAAGPPLPRRVLRSSSQNARLHSVLDQPSFLRQGSPITLEQVLRNTSMRRIFHHHVEKTFCAENIEFYVAVHRYKNLFPNAVQEGAIDTIKQSAEHIYSTFMAPESAKQINVDVTMARNVKAKLDNPTKEMFDEAQRAIQELVHCSILPKFYQSTEFRTTAEFEEVKQALVVENEKLRRMLASLSEQRNRIALLEQKRAMLHQYYNNFEETAAELSRKRREKELRLLSEMGSAYDAPAVRGREAVGGREAQGGGAQAEQQQQQQQQEKGLPALRRWALWSDQAKPYTPALDHLLSIEVIEAKDLVARDKRGFSNPYVVVKYGKQKYTTRTVFKNLNPRWREHFLFNVKQEEAHKLWLTVWDYNVIGSGEFLGCLSFASPRLFINSSDRWWTLEARKDGELVSGKIRLILHFRKQMDRDEELELELQKVRSAIREEMVTLQKTSGPGGLWAGRPQNQKDDGAGGAAPRDQVEKLVRTLNERRQKLEKEVVDRNRERGESSSSSSSTSSSSSLSLSSSGQSSSSPSSSLDSRTDSQS